MSTCIHKDIYKFIETLHGFFWTFVITAWIFPQTALFNVLVLIPLVYFIHMLPQHPLNVLEKEICPDLYKDKQKKKGGFDQFAKKAERFCTYSPITYQGFLIFGFITSIISLYTRGYIKLKL